MSEGTTTVIGRLLAIAVKADEIAAGEAEADEVEAIGDRIRSEVVALREAIDDEKDRHLAVIDLLLDRARAEVARLERRERINAALPPPRESHCLPGDSMSAAVEEQIALLVARGQVTALNAAWAAVSRRQRKSATEVAP